ncbi:MAG TPA: hypothetical protein VFE44_08440, partial [Thermoanaerobaculia bacterium]|nr:hypothetical protein [Thermoanaerobaculia bacterium]
DLEHDWDIFAQWVPGSRPIASTPAITGTGLHRLLSWTISEASPGSIWAVLRSRNDGSFETVAQVTAGASVEMSWEDTSPPGGVLKYRIRRVTENPNYATESAEATWPPQAKPLALARPAGAGNAGELELSGAAQGPVHIKVFDVQGRVVLERRVSLSVGTDLRLDLSDELRSRGTGIYFARAQDGSGRPTPPIKLVLLK